MVGFEVVDAPVGANDYDIDQLVPDQLRRRLFSLLSFPLPYGEPAYALTPVIPCLHLAEFTEEEEGTLPDTAKTVGQFGVGISVVPLVLES